MKAVAIARDERSAAVAPTPETVARRAYPLARPIYLYFTLDNAEGDPAPTDPRVREFVRYILSRQGQEAVASSGTYLPLNAALAQAQQAKADHEGWPAERTRP